MTVFAFGSTLSFKDRLILWVTIIKPEEFYLHTWMTLGNSWFPAGGRVGQGSGARLECFCVGPETELCCTTIKMYSIISTIRTQRNEQIYLYKGYKTVFGQLNKYEFILLHNQFVFLKR